MTSEINAPASRVFVAYWGEQIVGYRALIILPNGDIRDFYMGHRLVVLPDYQGLGIGTKFNNWTCEYMLSQGLKAYVKTAHFKLMNYYEKSPLWEVSKKEVRHYTKGCDIYRNNLRPNENPYTTKKPFKIYDNDKGIGRWINRTTMSAQYMGKDYIKPHKCIIFEAELEKNKIEEVLNKYIDKNNYYYEVLCDYPNNGGVTTSVCHKLGLRSLALYYRDDYNINLMLDTYNKQDIIYIYDENHCRYLSKLKGVISEKINTKFCRAESIFDL